MAIRLRNESRRPDPETRRSFKHRARVALVMLVVFWSAVFVSVAVADSYTTYANYIQRAPGGYATSDGWNSRDWNHACRAGNSGQMSVGYYDTGMTLVHWSGVAWTNCFSAIVGLEQNGYYRGRCWNEGVVTMTIACQMHNV